MALTWIVVTGAGLLPLRAARAQNGPMEWDLDGVVAGGPAGPPADTSGWSGSANAGFTLTAGNSRTTNLSLGLQMAYALRRQAWTLSGQYLRATTDGDQTANRGTGQLQYDYYPGERFFLFGRAQIGYDKPAGLTRRLAPAAGAGYVVVGTDRLRVSLEGGASWIQDRFVNDSTDAAVHAALGQKLEWSVSQTTKLTQQLNWSPKVSDLGQYLLHGEVGITTTIVGGLGLNVDFQDDFNSAPYIDPTTGLARHKNDLTLITGLSFSF